MAATRSGYNDAFATRAGCSSGGVRPYPEGTARAVQGSPRVCSVLLPPVALRCQRYPHLGPRRFCRSRRAWALSCTLLQRLLLFLPSPAFRVGFVSIPFVVTFSIWSMSKRIQCFSDPFPLCVGGDCATAFCPRSAMRPFSSTKSS